MGHMLGHIDHLLGHIDHLLGHMAHRHHVLRNGTYHYRRRVPADVQPHVGGLKCWKQTLKTGNEREAEVKARALASAHDRLIARLRGLPLPKQLASLTAAIDAAESELAIAQESTAPNKPCAARAGAQRTQALDAQAKLRRTMLAAAEQRLDTLPATERKAIADMGGIEAFFSRATTEASEIDKRRILVSLLHAVGKLPEREAATIEAALQTQGRYASKDQHRLVKLGLVAEDDAAQDPDNPRVNTATQTWFNERKQGTFALKRHRVAVRRFVEMHGNVPVGDITKQMMRDYLKCIENLPDHRKLPAKQRGLILVSVCLASRRPQSSGTLSP